MGARFTIKGQSYNGFISYRYYSLTIPLRNTIDVNLICRTAALNSNYVQLEMGVADCELATSNCCCPRTFESSQLQPLALIGGASPTPCKGACS